MLAGRGEIRIRAYTDAANHAMRAAFARGGYAETVPGATSAAGSSTGRLLNCLIRRVRCRNR